MTTLECPVVDCDYSTPESSEVIACALLGAHSTIHINSIPARFPPAPVLCGPKLERPKVDISLEEWNVFKRRWDAFVIGSGLDATASSAQLFQCAGETLDDSLLKSNPTIVSGSTADLLFAMKNLAAIAVATGVTRSELMQMRQDRDESFRAFTEKVRGKAETCGYTVNCACDREVNFTDIIIRGILIAGIADTDIRRKVLSTAGVLHKSVNDIIALVEGKEMARNAIPVSSASISSFKRQKSKPPNSRTQIAPCPECGKSHALFSEGVSGWNTQPHKLCIDCYQSHRQKHRRPKIDNDTGNRDRDKSGVAFLLSYQPLALLSTMLVQHCPLHHLCHL